MTNLNGRATPDPRRLRLEWQFAADRPGALTLGIDADFAEAAKKVEQPAAIARNGFTRRKRIDGPLWFTLLGAIAAISKRI